VPSLLERGGKMKNHKGEAQDFHLFLQEPTFWDQRSSTLIKNE